MINTEKPISAVKYNGQELPMAGTTITDGVVVTARNTDGFPTEATVYGEIYPFQFSYSGEYYHNTIGWRNLAKLTLTGQTVLAEGCFGYLPLVSVNGFESILEVKASALAATTLETVDFLPNAEVFGQNVFRDCAHLKTVSLPSAKTIVGAQYYSMFRKCTALENVTLGGIGSSVDTIVNPFGQCPQNGLAVTIYTKGYLVDKALTEIRNGATNATIIIKAAETTTYNGTEFAAGDTIVTSTVETEGTT